MIQYIKEISVQILCIYLFQSMTFILSLHTFNRVKIEKKSFTICTLIFMVGTYLIRLLPIHFGVHTLLSLILLIFLGIHILNLPIYSSVKATLVSTVILLGTEAINIFLLKIMFSEVRFVEIMEQPISKAVAGVPGNLLFFLIITLIYKYLTKGSTDEKVV